MYELFPQAAQGTAHSKFGLEILWSLADHPRWKLITYEQTKHLRPAKENEGIFHLFSPPCKVLAMLFLIIFPFCWFSHWVSFTDNSTTRSRQDEKVPVTAYKTFNMTVFNLVIKPLFLFQHIFYRFQEAAQFRNHPTK